MKPVLKQSPILAMISSSLVDLPSPSSLNYMWNFGSLLAMCLGVQIITGLFLAIHYMNSVDQAFYSVSHIMRDVNLGWGFRIIHANGASLFFLFLFSHTGRGLYHNSYLFLSGPWLSGTVMLILTMAVAFLGYVLPWGQMSYWGATVITNLFSAIPWVGGGVVSWLWGGFSVSQATLSRFFVLHFFFPFILAGLAGAHLVLLHVTGSSNPLGLSWQLDKVPFQPYFALKDLMGLVVALSALGALSLQTPWLLGDAENFNFANPLVTPAHIQPEWYFLFAYAVLRAIPNKLGGVIALAVSVGVLALIPLALKPNFQVKNFYPVSILLFWVLVSSMLGLTWIGARPVEAPYISMGQGLTCLYFSMFLSDSLVFKLWDSALA